MLDRRVNRMTRVATGFWTGFSPGPRAAAISVARAVGLLIPLAHVVVHVANHRKNASNLDGEACRFRTFELKPIVSGISGRDVAEFGTVRPRVQIPGPDQFLTSPGVVGPISPAALVHIRRQ